MNDEMRDRSDQLDDLNGFLEAVLTSLRAGVAVLDMHIQIWNRPPQDLWGLRSEEAIGQHFLNPDIGLPVERLRSNVRRAVAEGGDGFEQRLTAINRFGREVEVRVVGTALRRNGDGVRGAILVMEVETPAGVGSPHGG
jgi:two-component system CheB/CheR fusion protein